MNENRKQLQEPQNMCMQQIPWEAMSIEQKLDDLHRELKYLKTVEDKIRALNHRFDYHVHDGRGMCVVPTSNLGPLASDRGQSDLRP